MKKIEDMSVLELKAHVYDLSNTLRMIQQEVQIINQEIQKREQDSQVKQQSPVSLKGIKSTKKEEQ